MMLGAFHPSIIEARIEEIMDFHAISIDLYSFDLTDKIVDYLSNTLKIDFQLCCSDWPDETGGTCAVAFIDDGYPHLVMFDYKY